MGTVEYRDVAGFPGYHVGTDGSVWRYRWLKRVGAPSWRRLGQRPRSSDPSNPYLRVALYRDGRKCFRDVHRLVLEAFAGPCPAGMECCHGNGDPLDNRLNNLRWGTKADNLGDKERHGRVPKGSRHWKAVLCEEQVKEIRGRLAAGEMVTALAREFGARQSTISHIKSGKLWSHVP